MRKLFLLSCLFITIVGQTQTYSGHLQLRSGLSVPLFEYSSNTLKSGCFTNPGLTTSVAISGKVYKHWNFVVQSGLQLHPVSVGLLGYYKVLDDPFLLDVTIRSAPYTIIHLVGGPEFSYNVSKKTFINAAIYSGTFLSTTPHQIYKPTYYMVGPEFYEISSASDLSFAYGAGLTIGYQITPCYEIAIVSDILRSKAGFNFISQNGVRTDWRQITMLNISASLMLKLKYTR